MENVGLIAEAHLKYLKIINIPQIHVEIKNVKKLENLYKIAYIPTSINSSWFKNSQNVKIYKFTKL